MCSMSCVLHMQGPDKIQQSTMAQNLIERAHPHYWMKPPNLQPLPLLCFTDISVPSEHAPLGCPWSYQTICTSHQLCSNLNFSITVQARSWPSGHKSTNACIFLLSLLQHSPIPPVKGEQTCPYIFMTSFCVLIFIFSVILLSSHPHQCGYLRPLPDWKNTTFTPFCQQQQWSTTMSIGWENMTFHFLQPFTLC